MVKIPQGVFLMGSPEDEYGRFVTERPQHEVIVNEFFCGRYPITQEQWRVVVNSVTKIERELDPDPSYFKDDYENYSRWSRPVEQVSWYDAQEFCARLSRKTEKKYGLPSEAQWEYACRGYTTTPFHFGETISRNLANYSREDKEIVKYPLQTTPVGYFKVANSFGLYDMHGNVLEWCEDDWHFNYQGAPGNDSAWRSSEKNSRKIRKMQRGGSWYLNPRFCRSADRSNKNPLDKFKCLGIRVVCSLEKKSVIAQ